VVVADIPPKFGIMLSRSQAAKIKGALQLDMSYATIPIFGENRRLYREKKLAYMVNIVEKPNNHPIYSLDTDMGSTIFFNGGGEERFSFHKSSFVPTQEQLEGLWNVSFDGAVCKEWVGVGVWVQLLRRVALNYSYKFAFECTNNEAEYEALMLEIQVLKIFQVKRVVIHGDYELVIKQLQ